MKKSLLFVFRSFDSVILPPYKQGLYDDYKQNTEYGAYKYPGKSMKEVRKPEYLNIEKEEVV